MDIFTPPADAPAAPVCAWTRDGKCTVQVTTGKRNDIHVWEWNHVCADHSWQLALEFECR